jgi:hypothetical protein
MLLPPVLVVQAMTAHVGPTPSTRGPSVIFSPCAFGACFGAAVADAAKAAVKTMIVSNFIDSIPPLLGSDQYADVFGVEPEIQGFQGIFMVEKTPLLATS